MSDKSLILAIAGLGVALGGLILSTDDGAKIDALETKIDAKIDALEAKTDVLDNKVDDIRVYIAAKHGDQVSFTPMKTEKGATWLIKAVDSGTGEVRRVGTLAVQGDVERRAVLRLDNGGPPLEWTHLGRTDSLRRA